MALSPALATFSRPFTSSRKKARNTIERKSFNQPAGLAEDPTTGNIYVADTGNDTIRMIATGGVVTTLAGTAGTAGSTDGTGSAALFNGPADVAADSATVARRDEMFPHANRLRTNSFS